MEQGRLFEPPARTQPRLPAKNNGPTSSFVSAVKLTRSGRLGRQLRAVLEALAAHPDTTSAELAEAMKHGDVAWRYVVGRRLPDGRVRGLCANGPHRPCRVTSELAMTWRLSAEGRARLAAGQS